MENFSKLKAHLLLEKNGLSFLGDQRVTLLEAIATHGSITSAAKAIGMSYKAAWDTVDTMNNLSDHPLVRRSIGGRHGGGTILTEHGQQLVKVFREGEKKFQGVMEDLATDMESFTHLQDIYKRFSMRTSARNQFLGKIKKITKGAVNAEIKIGLDDHNEIVSVITAESVELMDLAVGVEVYALIKAPSIVLTTEVTTKFSAENRLCGVIARSENAHHPDRTRYPRSAEHSGNRSEPASGLGRNRPDPGRRGCLRRNLRPGPHPRSDAFDRGYVADQPARPLSCVGRRTSPATPPTVRSPCLRQQCGGLQWPAQGPGLRTQQSRSQ